MPNSKSIGQRIKHLRSLKEISQTQLAQAIGVTRQAVCNYETGDSIPSDEMKMAIAQYFGESIEDIFFKDYVNKKITT